MTGPEAQERKAGHVLLPVAGDVHAEVSLYNGKVYFSIRRWFQADDGKWYRTKNGLHLKYDDMIEVLTQATKLCEFGTKEAARFMTQGVKDETGTKEASGDVEY
jgi:hypothetical protein